jgi:hypothetical protein
MEIKPSAPDELPKTIIILNSKNATKISASFLE